MTERSVMQSLSQEQPWHQWNNLLIPIEQVWIFDTAEATSSPEYTHGIPCETYPFQNMSPPTQLYQSKRPNETFHQLCQSRGVGHFLCAECFESICCAVEQKKKKRRERGQREREQERATGYFVTMVTGSRSWFQYVMLFSFRAVKCKSLWLR